MKFYLWLLALTCLASQTFGGIIYSNDFEKAELDKVPDEMIVLDGAFAVHSDGKNKYLELPGAPLEAFGVLYGPPQVDNVGASARFFGTGKGRRYPAFALGVSGAGGYKLQVSPAKRSLEIFKGDTSLAATNFQWKSATWTKLKIELRKEGEKYVVRGKAWPEGEQEPKDWLVTFSETQKPPGGPTSIWGNPFSGQPIRFDDLIVNKLD